MLDLFLWRSIIHRRRPAQKGVATEEAAWRKEKWAAQCPPYVIQPIVGDTNLSSDASAGDLCMLIFIDLAHLFMRRGHCLPTHHSTKLAILRLVGRRRKTLRPGGKKQKKTYMFVCLSTCSHLPPSSRISHRCASPPHWEEGGRGSGVVCGALCLGGWTLFVNVAGDRHSHRRRPAASQRCRACKLLCLHAALTILTQMRSDNWGCSLINNIKMEGVSWWLHGPL